MLRLLARQNCEPLPDLRSATELGGSRRGGLGARSSLGGTLPSHYQTGSIRCAAIPLRRARLRVRQVRVNAPCLGVTKLEPAIGFSSPPERLAAAWQKSR